MKNEPKIFWGTAPTGEPQMEDLILLGKIVAVLRAGLDVTTLYAEIYSFLGSYHHPQPPELIEHRKKYYHILITATLQSLGVQTAQINSVDESSCGYTEPLISDFDRCCSLIKPPNTPDTTGEEGQAKAKTLGPLLYCVHQNLVESHLDTNIQLGSESQNPIFQHSSRIIPQLDYPPNTISPSPNSTIYSSSPSNLNISFLDSPLTITHKIHETPISTSSPNSNPILSILRTILIPLSELRLSRPKSKSPTENEVKDEYPEDAFVSLDAPKGTVFTVEVAIWCFGVCVKKHYACYEDIEADFWGGGMGEEDLKGAVARSLGFVLEGVRRRLSIVGGK